MSEKHCLVRLEELPPGTSREFTAGGRIIAVFNIDGTVHAIDGLCAHAGGPVARGILNGSIVTCPWHGWQYDVTTGRHCLTPNICQQRFPVTIVDGSVYVEV